MKNERVNEIDLLRFFSALAVVLYHYSFRGYAGDNMTIMPLLTLGKVSRYGYLGVDLFFIISGFVILMTAASGSLKRFVVSRIVRLYPAFWACCTITFVVTLLCGEPRFTATIYQYLVNMTMFSGFLGIDSIDGAYWSLFIEMKFYALVVFVLLIGKIKAAQIFLSLWLLLSFLLQLVYMKNLRSLLMTDYSSYFIAGATFYLIWSEGLSLMKIVMILFSWLLAVYKSTSKLSSMELHYNSEMSVIIVAAIVTIFFVVMLLVSLRLTGVFGRSRCTFLGALTYPLYLVHQNVGYIVFNNVYPQINPSLLLCATIVVMLIIGHVVHVYVEKRLSKPMKDALMSLIEFAEKFLKNSIQKHKKMV